MAWCRSATAVMAQQELVAQRGGYGWVIGGNPCRMALTLTSVCKAALSSFAARACSSGKRVMKAITHAWVAGMGVVRRTTAGQVTGPPKQKAVRSTMK